MVNISLAVSMKIKLTLFLVCFCSSVFSETYILDVVINSKTYKTEYKKILDEETGVEKLFGFINSENIFIGSEPSILSKFENKILDETEDILIFTSKNYFYKNTYTSFNMYILNKRTNKYCGVLISNDGISNSSEGTFTIINEYDSDEK